MLTRFHIFLIILATMLICPLVLQAQNGLRISIESAPKSANGKDVVLEKLKITPVTGLSSPGISIGDDTILATVFDETIPRTEAYRFKIENRTGRDLQFLIVGRSSDQSCSAVMPLKQFTVQGLVVDSEVPVKSVANGESVESPWQYEDTNDGAVRFAILASPRKEKLQKVFMTVEALAGLATGRASPDERALTELKLGEVKGKSEFSEFRVGGQRITITLGNVYSESGEGLQPAAYYDALMLIADCRYQFNRSSVPLETLKIGWLNNRGLANYQTGDLAKAKADFEAALALIAKPGPTGERPAEALVTRTNLAQVYATLGDHGKAIENYQLAQTFFGMLGSDESEKRKVAVYGGLGTSLESQKKYAEAEASYQKAIQIAEAYKMDASLGILLNSLGRLSAVNGKRAEAEKYFQQAIEISERSKNQPGIASASNNLGWFYVQDKRYADAEKAFMRSSDIFQDLGNRTAQATALGNLMFVERLLGRPEAAVFFGKRAVELLQSVRSGLTTIEKQLQRSFLMTREETYRSLADILISLDRLAEAEAIIGLLKIQEYASLSPTRGGDAPATVPYSDAEESLQLKIDELADLRKTRSELQAERARAGDAFTRQAELDRVDKSIGLVNASFARSLLRLATAEKSVSTKVSEILRERNLQSVLSTLKKDHGTDAVAIYTVIGTDEERDQNGNPTPSRTKFGWAVLVTPTDRKAYPIDVRGLEESVRKFRTALRSDRYDPKPEAQKLYKAIFQQTSPTQQSTLEKDLAAALSSSENKTVMWSLDGVLRYVPMAALNDGSKYLVEKYRNVVFTPQSLAQMSVSNNPNWQVLGLGVSEARPGFQPLIGAKEELEFIVRPGMFDGTVLLNQNFRKDEALRLWRDKKYPVIHIASHFKFHPTKAEESFLLIGDGELHMSDIQFEDALFDSVDLLTLSACDTAMSSNGKESESFAYLAQDLGAKTVLASLWPVSDLGTPELMRRFYTLRAKDRSMTKGEAFHRAQISLLNGSSIEESAPRTKTNDGNRADEFAVDGSKPNLPLYVRDPRRPFAHPFYWAPFILIGNWT